MPGKFDYGSGSERGQYFPGSDEGRAWDEGWRYRYGGTAAARPITGNPFSQTTRPAEYEAWRDGWTEANGNTNGDRRMPATTGTAPT